MPPIRGRRQLTRDEGIQILAFRRIGMTYEAIAKMFRNVSPYQVEYVVQKGHPTPRYFFIIIISRVLSNHRYLYSKRSGRPPLITDKQLQELTAFVCASSHNRRLPWAQLPLEYPMCTWENATEWTISSAMKRAGFRRRIARTKPPISEENRLLRLAFAHEHLNWTREQ
jgi:hypothetical protein